MSMSDSESVKHLSYYAKLFTKLRVVAFGSAKLSALVVLLHISRF
jgi:hypothetical protein